jgi:dihydropteroate synthase
VERPPDYNIRVMRLASYEDAVLEVGRIGVDSYAVPILAFKALGLSIKVEHLNCAQSNIIKQTALSVGADAAVARSVVTGCSERTDLILFCNRRQLEEITERLEIQPFDLKSIARELKNVVENSWSPRALVLPGNLLDFSRRTYVVGVLNVTPDSFSDGGEHFGFAKAVEWGRKMVEDGADIIDIGGESTRPGSEPVSAKEELNRVIPVIQELSRGNDCLLSIDTQKSEVAKEAISAGCSIVNDISGLSCDRSIAATVAEKDAGLVIGHIRGTPLNMQQDPHYDDLMSEITGELRASIELAESEGVDSSKIVIDPGIGFGKRVEDNLTIIRRLYELKSLGKPIMIGPSRKSFIGKILGLPVKERLEGTAAAVALAAANGADLVRVHDVKEMKKVCLLVDALTGKNHQSKEPEHSC